MSGVKGQRAKPDLNSVRARAWRAMRILREFTGPQLRSVVEGLSRGNAEKWFVRLAAHGVLRVKGRSAPKGTPGSHYRYLLTRDDGPDYPTQCTRCGQPISAPGCVEKGGKR